MKLDTKTAAALLSFSAVLICLFALGCPRTDKDGDDKLLAFSATGELLPRAGSTVLFRGEESALAEVAPLLQERDLVHADLAGALEFGCQPLGRDEVYKWRPEWLDYLSAANIRVINLADDHALDCGREALHKSARFLMAEGFYYAGAGSTQKEAQTPVYITVNNITVSILSFLLERPPGIEPCPACSGPSLYKRQALISGLREMKDRSDFRIVVLHYQEKDLPSLSAEELRITRAAIDFGADLVLGYGARSAGGLHRLRGKWAITGMGTFTGKAVDNPEKTADGFVLCAEFRRNTISNLRLMPVRLDEGRPSPVRGDEGRAVLENLVRVSGPDVRANSKITKDILYLK
ncbi:MAG: CapA family protein [bacterium]